MTALLLRSFRGAVTASRWAVAAPAMLIMLILYLAAATFAGFLAAYLVGLALEVAAGIEIVGTVWEIVLAIPLFVIAWLFAGALWAEKTGAILWFRRLSTSGHGSARFATAKERAALQHDTDGLLIGRDPKTGAAR